MKQAEGKIEEEKLVDRRWFVCTTHWRQEKVALENLRNQRAPDGRPLFEAYLPMHQQLVRPKGQPERIVPMPFFPRYLFVNLDVASPGWTSLYSTRGIVGVLPSGRQSTLLLAQLVRDMRERETSGFLKLAVDELPCRWQPGDVVAYGAFRKAIFCERVDERRCTILVSFIGGDSTHVVDLSDLSDSVGT